MDEILWSKEDGYTRRTNNLGGFEGGRTNGQPIVVRGVMKPIPTLYKPPMSVIETHEPYKATVERSDPTAFQQPVGHGSCCGNGFGTRNPRKILIRQSRGIKRSSGQTPRLYKELLRSSYGKNSLYRGPWIDWCLYGLRVSNAIIQISEILGL